ncbi:MAG: hypothetical protein AABN95_16855 [Acidobacteriota bacterium]
MAYRITIYSPDQHILYEGSTPDQTGVGGGTTARLRLAQALARRGHRVTVAGNVPRLHTYQGVTFQPLLEVKHIEADVLILNSTGGTLDRRRVLDLKWQCG